MFQSNVLFKTDTHYSNYRKRDPNEQAELATPQLGEARSFDKEILIEINRKNDPYRLFLSNLPHPLLWRTLANPTRSSRTILTSFVSH